MTDDLGDVMPFYAPYGHKGQIHVGRDPVQIRIPYGGADVFLGPRGEDGPHADVVRPGGHGGAGLFRGVRGQADDFIRSHQRAHRLHRQILLSHVHAVGVHQHGDIHMIVHDETCARLPRHTAQFSALTQHFSALQLLFPILENPDARVQQRGGHVLHGTPQAEVGIGQGIQIRFTGQYSGHG